MPETHRRRQSPRPDTTRQSPDSHTTDAGEPTPTVAVNAGETVITLPTRFGTTVELRLTARSDGGTRLAVVREDSSAAEPPTWDLATPHSDIQRRLTKLDDVGGFLLGATTTAGRAVYTSLRPADDDHPTLAVETPESPRPTLLIDLASEVDLIDIMEDTMVTVEQATDW